MRGFEGWGRHLSSGPAAAAKATFALTPPSNLRETTRLTTSSPSSQSPRPLRVQRGDGDRQGRGAAGCIHRPIPEERIENAGQAAGQRDDGDVLAATCSDAQGPGPERLSRGGPAAEDREGGLNEQPAHARVPGLSDGAAALRLARAVLAGHEAEIGFELMRMVEAPDVVDGGEEGGGGDGADAGDRAQPWHAGILDREVLDRRVRVRELLVEGTHDSEQGRDQREQAARQGHRPDALGETLRTAGRHTVALLAEQGPDDRDVARARVDQGVAHPEAAPHVALGIGEPMGGAVGAEQAGLGQGAGITPVGLDLARPRRIHGREVRVRNDDLVAEGLEAARHPLAVGRGLDQDPGAGPVPEHGGETLALGADAPLDDLTGLGEEVDLAFPLVDIDANMVHGWPLPSAALTAACSCGAAYATTSSGRPAASSHLSSRSDGGLHDRMTGAASSGPGAGRPFVDHVLSPKTIQASLDFHGAGKD